MNRGLALVALLAAACATVPAVSPGVQVAPDSRPACAANCEKMGLRLAAVVLVRNSVGCVCAVPEAAPAGGAPSAGAVGSAAVAGGVLVAEEEESEQASAWSMQTQQIQAQQTLLQQHAIGQ